MYKNANLFTSLELYKNSIGLSKSLLHQKFKSISNIKCPKNNKHEISVNMSGDYVCTVCRKVILRKGV